ncbi:MAG TPA: hypothetical protein P5341_13640, partial [Hyphomonas sp.]|nr:hypothetical protein [Hyphomonas sp.]
MIYINLSIVPMQARRDLSGLHPRSRRIARTSGLLCRSADPADPTGQPSFSQSPVAVATRRSSTQA